MTIEKSAEKQQETPEKNLIKTSYTLNLQLKEKRTSKETSQKKNIKKKRYNPLAAATELITESDSTS